MLAIVSALSHPSVNRLTETWSRINAKDRKTFENLQKFAPEQEGRQLLQSIFQQIKVRNKVPPVLRNRLRNDVIEWRNNDIFSYHVYLIWDLFFLN